jgi:ABC-type glycerol-3-phosphate transport system permease component
MVDLFEPVAARLADADRLAAEPRLEMADRPGGVSVMLPVLLFTVLVRRYLVSGLTAGGVKE